MTLKVIDISNYNELAVADWAAIAKTADAAILRAGFRGYGDAGTLALDKQVKGFISKCNQYGIPYGLYFVTQAITEAEAVAEVQWLQKQFGDLSAIKWGVWCDIEESGGKAKTGKNYRMDKLSVAKRTQILVKWCQTCEATGAFTGIYTSTDWFRNMLDDSKLTRWAHWVAQYASKCYYTGTITGWQFSSSNAFKINALKIMDCSYFYQKVSDSILTVSDVNSAIAAALKPVTASISTLTSNLSALTNAVSKLAPTDAALQKSISALAQNVTEIEKDLDSITDISGTGDSCSDWAKPYVQWAVDNGIFDGDNGDYGWDKCPTREQLACLFYNLHHQEEKVEDDNCTEENAEHNAAAETETEATE